MNTRAYTPRFHWKTVKGEHSLWDGKQWIFRFNRRKLALSAVRLQPGGQHHP